MFEEGFIKVMIAIKRIFQISILLPCMIFIHFAQAETAPNGILITPFHINGKQDHQLLVKMISDMLFTRLSSAHCMPVVDYRKLTVSGKNFAQEKDVRSLAKENHLSHFIMGSISVFGGQYSIDAQIWQVSDNKPFHAHASLASSENAVIPKIHDMSLDFQKALCQNNLRFQPQIGFVSKNNGFSHKAFPQLDFEIHALAVADINHDHHQDIIVSDTNTIYIFDIKNDFLDVIGQYEADHSCHILRMDASDLDHDQKTEIFVTATNKLSKRLTSFVLQWHSNQLHVVLQNQPFYFRCFQRADQSVQLIGQKQSMNSFFSKKVFLLQYDQHQLLIQKAQAIPPDSNFASFHQGRFTGSKKDYVIIRPNNKLEILDASLRQKWISETLYAESKNILIFPKKQAQNASHDKDKYCYLNQRIYVHDVDHDHIDEIILSEHHTSSGGRLFQRFRQYNSGTITCLKWNGLGMIPLWKTPKMNGYISDYMCFDKNGDGQISIVVACVSPKKLFKPIQSRLLLFDHNGR
jgi:TolB-like protein